MFVYLGRTRDGCYPTQVNAGDDQAVHEHVEGLHPEEGWCCYYEGVLLVVDGAPVGPGAEGIDR